MTLTRTLGAVAFLALASLSPSKAHAALPCKSMPVPIVDLIMYANWSNMFPISVMGVTVATMSGARNPPQMSRQTPCTCPSRIFGVPNFLGFMVTWFQPTYVVETVMQPGCFPSLASTQLLPGFNTLHSSAGPTGGDSANQRRQVHMFPFPLGAMFDELRSGTCLHTDSSMTGSYVTEVDPGWQMDAWAEAFFPEAVLFANPAATYACIPDSITAQFGIVSDMLHWCVGGANVYPPSGTQIKRGADEMGNQLSLAKFLFRHHRFGALWQTIGPGAVCDPHLMPRLAKSQYRTEPAWPFGRPDARPIVLGQNNMTWGTIGNVPAYEETVWVVWRAVQCCVRF